MSPSLTSLYYFLSGETFTQVLEYNFEVPVFDAILHYILKGEIVISTSLHLINSYSYFKIFLYTTCIIDQTAWNGMIRVLFPSLFFLN